MVTRKAILTTSWCFVVIGSVAFCGCVKPPPQAIVEQPPAPQASEAVSLPAQPAEMPKLPPPRLEDVQQAVTRVFKDAAVIDDGRSVSFLVGDFNGDMLQDLAVILKPAEGKLGELNQEFPNWIATEPLEDLLRSKSKALAQPIAARPSNNTAAGQTIRFEKSDVLLAIVHGYGPKGWHDPDATQTHLLRNIVGTNMRVLPFEAVAREYKGVRPFPSIYGDLIQQTIFGESGFIHFTGGVYGWYDPRNFKSGPIPAHSAVSAMK